MAHLRSTPLVLAGLVALAGTLCACQANEPVTGQPRDPEVTRDMNRAMIQWMNNAAIDNAIITQSTLFPYHFAPHSSRLNDLGRRDLIVLGNHYLRHPGRINVRRGDATEDLHEARIATVARFLVDAGVPADHIVIDDGIPAGGGISSERVVQIQEARPAGGSVSSQ